MGEEDLENVKSMNSLCEIYGGCFFVVVWRASTGQIYEFTRHFARFSGQLFESTGHILKFTGHFALPKLKLCSSLRGRLLDRFYNLLDKPRFLLDISQFKAKGANQ